jgi:ribosome-associated protein
MLVISDTISIALRELTFRSVRSGGPGGQRVNKVATKVMLRWTVTPSDRMPEDVCERICSTYHRRINKKGEMVLTSSRFRDRARNVADCLEKLRSLIAAVADPPTVRRPTVPSKAAIKRRRKAKQRRAEIKKNRRPVRRDEIS